MQVISTVYRSREWVESGSRASTIYLAQTLDGQCFLSLVESGRESLQGHDVKISRIDIDDEFVEEPDDEIPNISDTGAKKWPY